MAEVVQNLVDALVEVLVVLIGIGLTWALHKLQARLEAAKQLDNNGIIDMVTDRVVALVEKEFDGASGAEKRQKAVQMVVKLLEEHGIKGISEDRILADIENGVLKLKAMQGQIPGKIEWTQLVGTNVETDVENK